MPLLWRLQLRLQVRVLELKARCIRRAFFVFFLAIRDMLLTPKPPRTGKHYKFKTLTFYAIEGLIAIHDDRPLAVFEGKDYTVHLPADIVERANSLADYGRNLQASPQPEVREDGRLFIRAANEMMQAVREAKHMGDPSDPAVQEYWAKHHKRPTISIGSGKNKGYPELPPLPKGQLTGRTALPDSAQTDKLASQVTNALQQQLRKLPKRKSQ